MSDFPNPYIDIPPENTGERYQRLAGEGADIAHLFGLDLTDNGRDSLAILIGEVEAWWHHSGHQLDTKALAAVFSKLSKSIGG